MEPVPGMDQIRIAVIGAGQRGTAYTRAIFQLRSKGSRSAIITAVVDPIEEKRNRFGRHYIWGPENRDPQPHEVFEDWKEWIQDEVQLRSAMGTKSTSNGANAHSHNDRDITEVVMVCILDELHVVVLQALADAGLIGRQAKARGWREMHVLCEKPLATSLQDVMGIHRLLAPTDEYEPEAIFGICHVLRYSPHNMMLRDLVVETRIVGDILSIEHTEPVGWWHFSHSYVRGNWRNSNKTAPSLLTKSSHDIDFILWMLCSAPASTADSTPPHIPSYVSSIGSNNFFRRSRKPNAAGDATNCQSCAHEPDCMYSATKLYRNMFRNGVTEWPVKVVMPDIEDVRTFHGKDVAERKLMNALAEDYDASVPLSDRLQRSWFGRCVWECDNDVCDDQVVTIQWEDDPISGNNALRGRNSKTATFHMIAQTEKRCVRRGRIYGAEGEVEYDGQTIRVHNFATDRTETYTSTPWVGGHGGGDQGLVRQFLEAVAAVKESRMKAADAQREFLGCSLEEVIRSHAIVFAAEEARTAKTVVDWNKWWTQAKQD